MENILEFDSIVSTLCGNLDEKDLKSLSLVSKRWFQMTSERFTKRYVLRITDSCDSLARNYLHVRIIGENLEDKLSIIQNDVESLCIVRARLTNFARIKRLRKLKELKLLQMIELPRECSEEADLIHNLELLQIGLHLGDIQAAQQLLMMNRCLKILSFLGRITYEPYNILLKNINLPNLEVFMFRSGAITCNEGLLYFFKDHPNLKYCSLTNSRINDEAFLTLLKSSRNLEKLIVGGCLKLTDLISGTINAMLDLKHLVLNNLRIHLKELDIKRLESFEFSRSEEKLTENSMKTLLPFSDNIRVLNLNSMQKSEEFPISLQLLIPLISLRIPNIVNLSLDCLFDDRDSENKELNIVRFEHLKELSLISTKLRDNLLCSIIAPKLRVLFIENSKVTRRGIRHLVLNSIFLEKVAVTSSIYIDSSDIIYLFEELKFLKDINAFECPNVKTDFLKNYFLEKFDGECKFHLDYNVLDISVGRLKLTLLADT